MEMTLERAKVKENSSDRLFARIRKRDDILRDYFSKIDEGNKAHEIRRLLEIGIQAESKGK